MKKIISILIIIIVLTAGYFFLPQSTKSSLVNFLILVLPNSRIQYFLQNVEAGWVREEELPIDKWQWEGKIMGSPLYMFANPDAVKTDDGYRIYSGDQENTYLAFSSDGLNWQMAEEPVFTKERKGGAAVVQLPDGRWRTYFQINLNDKEIIKSAVSEDGVKFEFEEGVRMAAGEESFKDVKHIGHLNIVKVDDGYRMYFDDGLSGPINSEIIDNQCRLLKEESEGHITRIHSAFSQDGLNWEYQGTAIDFQQAPVSNLIMSISPAVIKVGNEYRMYFAPRLYKFKKTTRGDVDNCRYDEHYDRLYLAVSEDGRNFNIVKKLNVLGIDPTVVKTDDGLRLYAWSRNKIYSYSQKIE